MRAADARRDSRRPMVIRDRSRQAFSNSNNMKRLGVGTYRMVAGNAVHEECLLKALSAGHNGKAFTMVDTSPNYGDGLAEVLVGQTLQKLQGAESKPEVATKFGFIQGKALAKHQSSPFPGAVEYTNECHHSIHPDFMRHQLGESLERLGVPKVDTYLVHNPEHLLMSKIPPGTVADANNKMSSSNTLIAESQDELVANLEETFVALEEEVQAGRIGRYGVSSNSFALPRDHPHFVPFER